MTTIVRVKRHREDDPVEALVLACKRRKNEETADEAEQFKTVLNFSGTVEEKDDKLAANTVVTYKHKSPIQKNVKNRVPNITSKQRLEQKTRSEDNRFKVVSCLRGVSVADNVDDTEPKDDKNLTIVDVSLEKDEVTSEQQSNLSSSSSKSSYVYDLYCVNYDNGDDLNDLYMDNLVSVHPLAADLEYRCGEDFDEDEIVDPYDDDSNDENNWRNDYPDSDHSISETDMKLAAQMRGFGLDDGYDLSSDSDEERYLNYGDGDEDDDNLICDPVAEDYGGHKYARYKACVIRELSNDDDD